MIIDAMDILYTQNLDAFALMTSDSDFTSLVMRILSIGRNVVFLRTMSDMPDGQEIIDEINGK